MTAQLSFIQSTPCGPGRALGAGSEYAESSWGATLPVERYPDNGFGSGEPWVSAGDGRGRATGQGADPDGFGGGLE